MSPVDTSKYPGTPSGVEDKDHYHKWLVDQIPEQTVEKLRVLFIDNFRISTASNLPNHLSLNKIKSTLKR